MSYRIFIIDTYYDDFLKGHYTGLKTVKPLAEYRHAELKALLTQRLFGTSDFYSKAFNTLGHSAEEFVANDEIGQKAWAAEHGIRLLWQYSFFGKLPVLRRIRRRNWFYAILEAQIRDFKPDIIFNQNIGALEPFFLKKIKNKYGAKIVGQIAARMPDRRFFTPYDMVFSSLPHYVETFRNWGIRSHFLKLAFAPEVLKSIPTEGDHYDTTHIGGYGPIHNERNDVLEQAAKRTSIDFWGYGTANLSPLSPILERFHGEAWGVEMYTILAHSKITLTKHISRVAATYANNMTLYEATGCGCLLITDARENLSDIFIPDKEVVTYNTPEELVEKIQFYLTHEPERIAIAKAGQQRTLRDHTYTKRAEEILTVFDTEMFPSDRTTA